MEEENKKENKKEDKKISIKASRIEDINKKASTLPQVEAEKEPFKGVVKLSKIVQHDLHKKATSKT